MIYCNFCGEKALARDNDKDTNSANYYECCNCDKKILIQVLEK